MTEQRCRTCRHWRSHAELIERGLLPPVKTGRLLRPEVVARDTRQRADNGQCRHRGPSMQGEWPETSADDDCGNWKEIVVDAAVDAGE